jgi:hypothetical protein
MWVTAKGDCVMILSVTYSLTYIMLSRKCMGFSGRCLSMLSKGCSAHQQIQDQTCEAPGDNYGERIYFGFIWL